ncbi:unnamed protein product, partial [Adineta ricciae]
AVHLIFVNILLTNLLIAIFSKRYDEVYDETKKIWHYQQYFLVRDYFTRSPFVPPISLVMNLASLLRMAYLFVIKEQIQGKSARFTKKIFKIIPRNESHVKKWCQFEGASTYKYAHDVVKSSKSTTTGLSSTTNSTKIDKGKDVANTEANANVTENSVKEIQDCLIRLHSSTKEICELVTEAQKA